MASGVADAPQVNTSPAAAGDAGSPQNGVEMNNLQQQQEAGQGQLRSGEPATSSAGPTQASSAAITTPQATESSVPVPAAPEASIANTTQETPAAESLLPSAAPDHAVANPSESIAPASADSTPEESSPTTASKTPVVDIVLLPMNGNRYPCKISAKYLRNQKIEVENMDPFNISVYTLKELIWRDWKSGMHSPFFSHKISFWLDHWLTANVLI